MTVEFRRTVAAARSLLAANPGNLLLVELSAWLLGAAGETGPDIADPVSALHARLAAALTIAGYRSAYTTAARRLLAGERAADVAADQASLLNETFDALERALVSEARPTS